MSAPSIFVIGAGPVATAMAGALRLGGATVRGLWARRAERAEAAAATAGVPVCAELTAASLREVEVVLVAVRDDAIGEVARALVDGASLTERHVLLHCSGASSGQDAFRDVVDRVGGVGVTHPLCAVADGARVMSELAGMVFGVQGDARGLAAARAVVAAIGGRWLELDGAQMAAYHAAAAMTSNYTVALVDAAAEVLAAAGIDRDEGRAALLPLLEGTLANLRERGVPAGLTGPIRRGDHSTVARHLAALDALSPALAEIYRVLGRRTLALARECGDAAERDLAAIAGLLADR